MKNIQNTKYGVSLEESASSITKGGRGRFIEHFSGEYN